VDQYAALGLVIETALQERSPNFTVVHWVSEVKVPADDDTIRNILTGLKKEARSRNVYDNL